MSTPKVYVAYEDYPTWDSGPEVRAVSTSLDVVKKAIENHRAQNRGTDYWIEERDDTTGDWTGHVYEWYGTQEGWKRK